VILWKELTIIYENADENKRFCIMYYNILNPRECIYL